MNEIRPQADALTVAEAVEILEKHYGNHTEVAKNLGMDRRWYRQLRSDLDHMPVRWRRLLVLSAKEALQADRPADQPASGAAA